MLAKLNRAGSKGNKMKTPVSLIGLIVCAAGIFFAGEGLGYINWPASSFMISQMKWVYYGGGIAVVGYFASHHCSAVSSGC